MDTYLTDICDLLRGVFDDQDKRLAPEALLEVKRILGGSVFPKIQMAQRDSAADSRETAEARRQFREQQRCEIEVIEAACLIVRAVAAGIRYALGDNNAGVEHEELKSDARRALFVMPRGMPEIADLQYCLDALDSTVATDVLASLSTRQVTSRPWLKDLYYACRFLGRVLYYCSDGPCGPHALRVFVTHHMGVLVSKLLFSHLKRHAEQNWGAKVRVCTGSGDLEHITLSIKPLIWLSDVHIVYIPNSLSLVEDGRDRSLDPQERDWVLEEICYSNRIRKKIHFVIGNGADKQGVLKLFKRQMRRYRCQDEYERIADEDCRAVGKRIHQSMDEHLRERMYTVHNPLFEGLATEDAKALLRKVFAPAVEQRLAALVGGVLLSMERDHQLLLRALCQASWRAGDEMGYGDVTVADVVTACQQCRRSDGREINKEWVARIIREHLAGKQVFLGEYRTAGPPDCAGPHAHEEHIVPLLEEGPRRGSSKTYRFSLHRLPEHVAAYYRVSVPLERLRRVFSRTFSNPGGLRH